MLIFDNIDADATIATVKPFVGYFYRDNNCIGIRFGYSHMGGTLDNTYFDAGEGNDLSGQLPYVDLSSDEYSFGIFHPFFMRGSTPKTLRALRRVRAGALDGTFELRIRPGS